MSFLTTTTTETAHLALGLHQQDLIETVVEDLIAIATEQEAAIRLWVANFQPNEEEGAIWQLAELICDQIDPAIDDALFADDAKQLLNIKKRAIALMALLLPTDTDPQIILDAYCEMSDECKEFNEYNERMNKIFQESIGNLQNTIIQTNQMQRETFEELKENIQECADLRDQNAQELFIESANLADRVVTLFEDTLENAENLVTLSKRREQEEESLKRLAKDAEDLHL